jgi:3',5'-cyclic-AMP phosphodiesterase
MDIFEYSPYVIDFEEENTDVNQSNIEKLSRISNNNTIRIGFTGDTHRKFDELDNFVIAVNELKNPVDFVIHVGDIADFGLPKQYEWGNSILRNLNYPYFVCLGNHDLVGNGGAVYNEMFGEYNFSFIYSDTKFIFVNTNCREFSFNGNVPSINWLDAQLVPANDFTNAIVIFHVPPMDADFDSQLEDDFHNSIAKYSNVLFTIHGHLHHHEIYTPYSDGIIYVNVFGIEHNKFNVIEILDGKFEIETYEL